MTIPRSPLAALLLIASTSAAAGPQVTLQADRTSAPLGRPLTLTLRVRGVADAPEVKPPTIDGATLTALGPPQVVSSFAADLEAQGILHAGTGKHFAEALKGLSDPNLLGPGGLGGLGGVDKNDYIYTYQLTPLKAGALTVAAFEVTAGGATAKTKPLAVEVTAARNQAWARVALSLSNPTPTVGEEVQLYVDLLVQRGNVTYGQRMYPHLPVKDMTLNVPSLENAAAVEPVKPLEVLTQELAVEPGKRGFRVNGLPTEVKLDYEPDGARLDPARYRRRLTIPLRVREGGKVTLPAATAAGDVYVPGGSKGHWEPFVAASEPLTFAAVDLRGRPDRPADFGGVVGAVRVTAAASQTRLAAGTPFALKVRLEGGSSVAQASAPDLAGRPTFAQGFRVRHEEEKTVGAGREFTYTLRPLSDAVKEVPPVEVSYYDPSVNAFATAKSEPIPLTVTPATNVTPADPTPAPVAPSPPAPSVETPAPPPVEAPPEASSSTDRLWAWIEIGLGVLCVAGLATVGVRTWNRRRAATTQHRQQSLVRSEVQSGLDVAATPADVSRTVQDFLRRRFGLPPGEVTPADAATTLRRAGVADDLATACADLLEACAAAEYAPGAATPSPDLASYARRLTEQLIV